MRKLFWCVLAIALFVPTLVQAFHGDVDPIPATMVTDREIEVLGVNSEGNIQGSDASGKQKLLFKDIEKITLANNVYSVTMKDGKKYELKFGRLTTHYTSPTFDCLIKNPDTGKQEEAMLDFTTIKSLTFKSKAQAAPATDEKVTAPATVPDSTKKPPTEEVAGKPEIKASQTGTAIDRKDPRAVAEALLKAFRSDDTETVRSLLNKTNQKKISPKEFPEMMKEMKENIGPAEKVGVLKAGPKHKSSGTVCAYLHTAGAEAFVIVLTKEGDEYGFEDINSPDAAQWEKLPELK